MKYSKTLGSVALSALLLMGMTGCGSSSDNDLVILPAAPTPAPTAPPSSDQVAIAELEAAEAEAIAASLVGVTDDDKIPFGDGSFSAFERVAVFPTVKDADGNLDHIATYAKVAELANTFAKHVANIDEPTSDPATFKGANWILGGTELPPTNNLGDDDVKHHMLGMQDKHLV